MSESRSKAALSDRFVEGIIRGAEIHGEASDAEMEIGDLQQALRAAWKFVPRERRPEFARLPQVESILEWLEEG